MRPWEKNIRQVVPYVPGEQPNQLGMIKLNTNENPYPPAPAVLEAWKELDPGRFRLYPDPACQELTGALAERYHVEEDEVFVGVGSDDVLAMAFLTFFNSGKPVFFPDITYSFYDVWADVFGIPYECQPLDEQFRIVKEDYYKPNGGVVFPNPNAPTGILQGLPEMEDIILHNQDVIVIIDEAYIDFGGESALELIHKYDNVLVVQTFSKSRSMAGMRIGYAFGNKNLIKYLNDVKYSFNSYTMNLPALHLGAAALKEEAYFQETCRKIIATRERVKEELKELGFSFGDSRANFLFVTHERIAARTLFEALKIKKIYVRYFNKPRIDNYLRITIGTDEEMDTLLEFLRAYVKEN
ncbi:MAG: histidinol-phosphate transaminase [Candidatus Limivivens sp.]|nr:histidinol-phosphate transaminase [Candidatus Limivivens sp.]